MKSGHFGQTKWTNTAFERFRPWLKELNFCRLQLQTRNHLKFTTAQFLAQNSFSCLRNNFFLVSGGRCRSQPSDPFAHDIRKQENIRRIKILKWRQIKFSKATSWKWEASLKRIKQKRNKYEKSRKAAKIYRREFFIPSHFNFSYLISYTVKK